ncbi:other/VPS15 protein kinase [Coprinopsis cinerea okayama7|uniref:non-specific serine/threonine protein kinase n=1 Tax=Coprinopsis cinerea (strain Okayama-7 / 130 / ATCC MYA-4618 / FGSC 9003) TaxID=240176 RepID=A8NZH1_COPC7|nr:other/VPS15 protein kinase [Coprinopsis cinerea okayama7\|eukprot:XP_001837678.2 other/VPS15 protein kinase [Coprinopsis cinerea okayama7\
MGNVHSGSTFTRTTGALDSYVADLGTDIIYEKSLGSSRFLKTVKCKHRNGYLVIKIFVKPDPGLTLRNYHKRLKNDKESLVDIANVYNYQVFVETERAGYIIRQWVASNLYDRISTRPFLTMVEKRWISFQLLNALRDARNRKVSHGDIKSENILVTSWNWVYLTDFASYKPTYLPLDDPSDFSFYFDTSGRRTCYLAPERFYTQANNPDISAKKSRIAAMEDTPGKRDGKVTEAMDCFSAGCVIAELFLEGAPLFTLSQLFKYREGELNVDTQLASIEDEGIRNLIKEMIHLDPTARPTFDSLLHTSRGTVFPETFYSFLHNYISTLNEPSPSTYSSTSSATTPGSTLPTGSMSVLRPHAPHSAPGSEPTPETLANDSDHRMERIWEDYESIEPYLCPEPSEDRTMDVNIDYTSNVQAVFKPFQDVIPVELHIPNRDSKLRTHAGRRAALEDGPALIILASVTSNIRNCKLPSSKVRALDVFLALSCHLTDEAKLDRMVPYIVELLHDDSALVRSAALRTLVQVLTLVSVITPSNVAIFPEYIIPNIKHLVQDPEVSVRCTYAQCIVPIADTAVRYLEMGQALKAHGAFNLAAEGQDYEHAHYEISYDASMQELQNHIQAHLAALLMDPSSVVKRAVLHNISSLCVFLGRQKTNDVLLSHMITYLNDRDWLLRYSFFESIVDVAACAGGRSLEEYILPLMIQALSGAAAFITSAAQQLPASDIWCIVYPSLRHFLKSDIGEINTSSLLRAMKPPLPRQILDSSVQWAMKADRSVFWSRPRRGGSKTESPRESVISVRKAGTGNLAKNRSEEDEVHINKLQQLGLTSSDESKLLAMRDYILKLANATASFSSRLSYEPDTGKNLKVTGDLELQKLGVVPQTVFLKQRQDSGSRMTIPSSRRSISSRTSAMSPRFPRPPSIDHGSVGTGAPFEDLRRRLASINNSVSSLSPNQPKDARSVSSPLAPSSSSISVASATAPSPVAAERERDRPPSPTESVVSNANSVSLRPASRLQVGSVEGSKAAPAVGSSKTVATGLLDAHSHIGSPDPSGRSSPLSMSATLRQHRPRVPSLLPISTYDGQEPGISNLLENLYLDNNRELQQDFGPPVHEGPIRRRNTSRHPFGTRDITNKRLEASLISNLTSHSEAITGIAVSPDHAFFVTASDDKTVKVWDTARLERNVTSKARHTYNQHHARVKCVCIIEGTHCFASAAEDGSLHVVRVQLTQSAAGASSAAGSLPKYGKLQVVREHRVESVGEWITCMVHYKSDSTSSLVYATTHSNIAILELRTMRVLQTMENPRHYGPITAMCMDKRRAWLVVGTSTGVLTLWDKRFGILLKSWQTAAATSSGKSCKVHQIAVHPTKGRGKWIIVALETSKKGLASSRDSVTIIEVWDVEKSVLVETFVVGTSSDREREREGSESPGPHEVEVEGVDANPSPAAAIAAFVRSRQLQSENERRSSARGSANEELVAPPAPDVRAMVVGLDFGGYASAHRLEYGEFIPDGGGASSRSSTKGFVVTGSDDRRLRFWDLSRAEKSVVFSGLEQDGERPTHSINSGGSRGGEDEGNKGPVSYVETWPAVPTGGQSSRPSQRISLITQHQQNLLKSHQDVVTALACIDSPWRGGIVSGDRAGVVKVWRLDYVE